MIRVNIDRRLDSAGDLLSVTVRVTRITRTGAGEEFCDVVAEATDHGDSDDPLQPRPSETRAARAVVAEMGLQLKSVRRQLSTAVGVEL